MLNTLQLPAEWSTLKKLIWLRGSPASGGMGSETLSLTAFAAPTLKTVTKKSKVTSCEVSFSPSQDLHGYDSPWPAGGGKNKWNPTTGGTAEGTYNGITYNKNNDGSYSFSGTATGSTWIDFGNVTLPAGTWTASVTETGLYTGTISFGAKSGAFITYPNLTNYPRTVTSESETTGLFGINFASGVAISGTLTLWIQIESGSSATSYSPYTNLCPISGWQGAEVTVDPMYGGLVEWNQTVRNGNFADNTNWSAETGVTYTISDNVATITSTVSYNGLRQSNAYRLTVGHKYFISFEFKTQEQIEAAVGYAGSSGAQISVLATGSNEWTKEEGIKTCTDASSGSFYVFGKGTYTNLQFRNVQCFDLTQMFGAGNEPSTVEGFRALFPNDYYAYNAGEVTNVSAVSGLPYSKTSVTFGQTVYGGTAEIVAGTGSEEWTTITLDGTQEIRHTNWRPTETSVGWVYNYSITNNATVPLNTDIPFVKCESLMTDGYVRAYNGTYDNMISAVNYGEGSTPSLGLVVRIADTSLTNATAINAYLAQNPLKVCYKVSTPTPYTFPPASSELLLQNGNNYNWAEMTND